MKILRSMNASILPLDEALERLQTRSLPLMSVALTFDDGFVDFLKLGLPALNEYQIPTTLYLTTYYTKHRLPIITLLLDYLLWKSERSEVDAPRFGIEEPLPIRTYLERQVVVRKLLSWAEEKNLCTIEKDEMAREIATRLGVDYGDILERRMLQIVSPEEAAELARAGVDLQLHTHRHKTPQLKELFFREILDNRSLIEEFSGRQPKHFCYPSGNYRAELLPWLQELEVLSATTCVRGLAHANSAPLIMPRVLDDETVDSIRFESFVAGLLT